MTNDETLRGDVRNLRSGDIRMGEPTSGNALVSRNEYIVTKMFQFTGLFSS